MHDEVVVEVQRLFGDPYEFPISEELKQMLMKELEFGVNLPIDQEFVLNAKVEMRHYVN
jgi:hypothetical protein